MSESEEEENFCFFGKPLQPYDEDSFPKKKPIALEDQIATDQQGRRRFHGAFTGGFSAGFYNTVGSLEGWTPKEFKSTRQEKAAGRSQRPEDFMDDEDIGEFGIAPQTVRATKDYAIKKRKRQVFNEGPIPGDPVLHSLLSSGNETIGYLLLKNIGLKDQDKAKAQQDMEAAEQKTYGCEMPRNYEISRHEEVVQYSIPEVYKEFLAKPKDNTFGLGYVGLAKSHLNLFQPKSLVISEKNKKKISITGQAFGVGAFEDDDEDIYVKDDMSRYDFELTSEKATKKDTLKQKKEDIYLEDFVRSQNTLHPKPVFLPPKIPQSFIGKHKVKKSRFEPLAPEKDPPRIPERKDMNPDIRARQLGEMPSTSAQQIVPPEEIKKEAVEEDDSSRIIENKTYDILSASGLIFDRFVSASKPEDPSNILEVVEKSHTTHGTQEMRDAAKLKMFGPLTRITTDWQPCSLLCKRFNVPEPHFDELTTKKKRTKNLIFEYQKFNDDLPELNPGLTMQNTPVEKEKDESIEENMETTQTNEIATENNKPADEPLVESKTNEDSTPKEVLPPPKDITEKINVEVNIDMFKAIFLSSSSESESEEESNKNEEASSSKSRNEEMRANILSDNNFIPKIKVNKEGILSNIDFSAFTTTRPSEVEVQDKVEVIEDNAYGPKLPQKPGGSSRSNVVAVNVSKNDDSNDEWVEKGQETKQQERREHKKKHKKHKKKHKHHKKSH